MNKIIRTYCYCFFVLLLSCSKTQAEKERLSQISSFLNQYHNYYYNYPATLGDFIQFCEERLPYSDSCTKNELLEVQNILKNNYEISWFNKDNNYPIQELVILYKQDTLFHLYDSTAFPCLERLIDLYSDIYYEYPESLGALMRHYSAIHLFKPTFWPTQVCDSVTVLCLERCQSQGILSWKKDEVGLLLMIRNDTIGYWLNYSYCNSFPNGLFSTPTRFFNLDGIGFYPSEELDQLFKKGIRKLGLDYCQFSEENTISWHLLKYNRTKGLSLFCEDDEVNLNTDYFKYMKLYLEKFVEENRLSQIIFIAPVKEKTSG